MNDDAGRRNVDNSEERLLWSLEETARQLGDVSTRTVRRLVERGELPAVRVGRLLRIPREGVRAWVDQYLDRTHNPPRSEPGVRKETTCHTDAKIAPSTGSASSTQAARELGVLLKLPTARKQPR
ncbi:MAG: helix-turn-helix domain-containing protein [Pseudomonadota bacterium]